MQIITALLQLPDEFGVGVVADNGSCFFNVLAQSLNILQHTDEYTGERLRLICKQYYLENKTRVDQWDKKNNSDINIKRKYVSHQHIKKELENSRKFLPMWTTPHIGGQILCLQLEILCIYLIEIIVNPKETDKHFIITKKGTKETAGREFKICRGNIPTLVMIEEKLYFISIPSSTESDLKNKLIKMADTLNCQELHKLLYKIEYYVLAGIISKDNSGYIENLTIDAIKKYFNYDGITITRDVSFLKQKIFCIHSAISNIFFKLSKAAFPLNLSKPFIESLVNRNGSC